MVRGFEREVFVVRVIRLLGLLYALLRFLKALNLDTAGGIVVKVPLAIPVCLAGSGHERIPRG